MLRETVDFADKVSRSCAAGSDGKLIAKVKMH